MSGRRTRRIEVGERRARGLGSMKTKHGFPGLPQPIYTRFARWMNDLQVRGCFTEKALSLGTIHVVTEEGVGLFLVVARISETPMVYGCTRCGTLLPRAGTGWPPPPTWGYRTPVEQRVPLKVREAGLRIRFLVCHHCLETLGVDRWTRETL